MSTSVDELLSICSDSIVSHKIFRDVSLLPNYFLMNELVALLNQKNGCYGFESALHILPFDTTEIEVGVLDWNKSDLWISSYDGLARGAFFFAEDIFGGQFCLKENGVYIFEPETGSFDYLAKDLNEWCEIILNDFSVLTGYPLAHTWQQTHGAIPEGFRLVPKLPFVAGGEYDIENLCLEESTQGMKKRAALALQIRDVPDGSSIKLNS